MTREAAVTVLISGRGSNLKALIEHQEGYRIGAVIANKRDAGGLQFANEHGIPSVIVERESSQTLADFKAAVLEATLATRPNFVALAGFMLVLQPKFIEAFKGRIINIHPSLLPQFPGLDTHARAVESGVRHHGCTVHYVDTGVDTGPLIAQASLELRPSDDAHSAAARVLTLEHALYPWALSCIARGEIQLEGSTVVYSEVAEHEARRRGFEIFPS